MAGSEGSTLSKCHGPCDRGEHQRQGGKLRIERQAAHSLNDTPEGKSTSVSGRVVPG